VNRCPCCALTTPSDKDGTWQRDRSMWQRLCDECIRYANRLSACQHTLDAERAELQRQREKLWHPKGAVA
jgi:hypothetical protein